MDGFGNSIRDFLKEKGFHCENDTLSGMFSHKIFRVSSDNGRTIRTMVLLRASAQTYEDAQVYSQEARKDIELICSRDGHMPLIIAEDRWHTQRRTLQERILAHMEIFFPIYARNCEVRRIDKSTAGGFLAGNHAYGDAACRHRYGLFLKRHTGHIAAGLAQEHVGNSETCSIPASGSLIAVATFSNARKWIKGDKEIRSYEWTRYASLPGMRVNGGMGKLLKAFIEDVNPDDIMSYADLEWSEGKVYEQIGFVREGFKEPVSFIIDTDAWTRTVHKDSSPLPPDTAGRKFFTNFGSAKYRLKLTDYE